MQSLTLLATLASFVSAPSDTDTATLHAELQPPATPLIWGDVDGDGLEDLYTLDPVEGDRLLINDGAGGFEDVTLTALPAGAAGSRHASLVDLDGDGDLDLHVISTTGESRVLRNTGSVRFEEATAGARLEQGIGATAVRWRDYDADGLPDLELQLEAGAVLYHNLGDCRFGSVVSTSAPVAVAPRPAEVAGPVAPAAPGMAQREAPGKVAVAGSKAARGAAKRAVRGADAGDAIPHRVSGASAPSAPIGAASTGTAAGSIAPAPRLRPAAQAQASSHRKLSISGDLEVTGSTGIGVTAPVAPLQLVGGIDVDLTNNGSMVIGPLTGLNLALDDNEIIARRNGATSILRLNREGGVISLGELGGSTGIGTVNPSEKLDVHGNIAVNGTMVIDGTTLQWKGGTGNISSGVDSTIAGGNGNPRHRRRGTPQHGGRDGREHRGGRPQQRFHRPGERCRRRHRERRVRRLRHGLRRLAQRRRREPRDDSRGARQRGLGHVELRRGALRAGAARRRVRLG